MGIVATQGPALQKVKHRTDARRGAHGIVAQIRGRCRTQQQADAAERMIRYLSRAQKREGDEIRRTWGQLAKGLGHPTEGLTERQKRVRFRARMANTLDYLQGWGYLELREALYEPNGEGRCILIRLRAGVAQSVGTTPFGRTAVRKTRGPSCSSFSGEVGTPRGGLKGGKDSPELLRERTESDAAGRASALSTRAAALSQAPVAAAFEQIGEQLGWEGASGALALKVCPELASAPIEVVAREAWRVAGNRDGRLSRSVATQLLRSSSQIERVGYGAISPGPAASRAAVIDLALGDWQDWWHIRRPSDRPPVTLGGLTCCLRKLARRCAKGARLRRRAGGRVG